MSQRYQVITVTICNYLKSTDFQRISWSYRFFLFNLLHKIYKNKFVTNKLKHWKNKVNMMRAVSDFVWKGWLSPTLASHPNIALWGDILIPGCRLESLKDWANFSTIVHSFVWLWLIQAKSISLISAFCMFHRPLSVGAVVYRVPWLALATLLWVHLSPWL